MSAFGDGRPDQYSPHPQEPFVVYESSNPETDHIPQHRRGSRLILAICAGVVALLVVGATAFGGSLLLGRTSSTSGTGDSVAGAASSGDVSTEPPADAGAMSGDPSPTEAATASATPGKPSSRPSTKAAQTTQPAKPKTTGPQATGSAAEEAQVLAIVNTERAKAGCKPLAFNAKLTAAARKHSTDMQNRNYFSHDTPEGVEFATRISNEGYKWSGAAENIAKGQRNPQDVMASWMNSSGHRANILNCNLKDLGVGLASAPGKAKVWTQDFGSPR